MCLCKEYSRQRESPQAGMNGEEASVVGVCVGWGGGCGGRGSNERGGDRAAEERGQTDGVGPWRPLRDLAFCSEQNGSCWRVSGQIMQAIPGILAVSSSFLTLSLSIYLSSPVGCKSPEDPGSLSYLLQCQPCPGSCGYSTSTDECQMLLFSSVAGF